MNDVFFYIFLVVVAAITDGRITFCRIQFAGTAVFAALLVQANCCT